MAPLQTFSIEDCPNPAVYYAYLTGLVKGYYVCKKCSIDLIKIADKLEEKISLTTDQTGYQCQMKEPKKNESKN